MPKKKPVPVILTTGNGAAIAVTPTERGVSIEIDDQHIMIYTSIVSDNKRRLRFEVEKARR